jgi:hypothetical protein
MSMLFDALLHLGSKREIDPEIIEGAFSRLNLGKSHPQQLLTQYRNTRGRANLDDPTEDIDVYSQLFMYGVLSALTEEDESWLDEFSSFTNDSDMAWKAVALFNLTTFFSYGEIYLGSNVALGRRLHAGNFSDPWFRHAYLFEVLSCGGKAQENMHPWSHISNMHGKNFLDIFGSDALTSKAVNGKMAQLMGAGLLSHLEAAVLNPELTGCYERFFSAYIDAHNSAMGSPEQGIYAFEKWDGTILRKRLADALLLEQFDNKIISTLFRTLKLA